MAAPQHGGAADTYYNGQPPMQYPPQAYNNTNAAPYQAGPEPKYQQEPPTYGQSYQAAPAPGGKETFAQTFKLDRPKYNDLWAGILACRPLENTGSRSAC